MLATDREIQLIKTTIYDHKLTQATFSEKCSLTASNLGKILNKQRNLTEDVRKRIDKQFALGLSNDSGVSRKELGSYARAMAEQDIAGTYVTVRVSADEPDAYYVFRTEIAWCEKFSCLKFIEKFRNDPHHHQGEIAVFTLANILYFISSSKRGHGYRLITVHRKATTGNLSGFMVSAYERADSHFIPIVAPIIYIRSDPGIANGMIRKGDKDFDYCETEIAQSLKNGPSKLLLPTAFMEPDN